MSPALAQDLIPPEAGAVPTPPDLPAIADRWDIPAWANVLAALSAPIVLAMLWFSDVIRPGSFARNKPAKLSTQNPAAILVAGLLIYLAGGMGGALAYSMLPWPRDVSMLTTKGQGVVLLGASLAGSAAALAVLMLMGGGTLRKDLTPRDPWLGFLALVITYPVIAAASWLSNTLATMVEGAPPDPIAHKTLESIVDNPADVWAIVLMACAVLGAPLVEEVIFRVCLQGAIARATGMHWVAVLVSAGLFALVHTAGQTVPWHAVPPLLVLGVSLGVVYARTGRAAPVVVMHAAFNVLNIALAVLLH